MSEELKKEYSGNMPTYKITVYIKCRIRKKGPIYDLLEDSRQTV